MFFDGSVSIKFISTADSGLIFVQIFYSGCAGIQNPEFVTEYAKLSGGSQS